MPRIAREMKPADFEHRALDAIDRLPADERRRFANVLRLLGYADSDRELIRLAADIAPAPAT